MRPTQSALWKPMGTRPREAAHRLNMTPELAARVKALQSVVRDNLRYLFDTGRVMPTQVAEACEVTVQAVSNWKRTGKITLHGLTIVSRLSGYSVDQIAMTSITDETERSQMISAADEIEMILAYREIRPDEQEKYRDELMKAAKASRDHVQEVMRKLGVTGTASNERVAQKIKPAPRDARIGRR